ncbi:MAG: endonuclease V [candidate division WOR-3 bacterium]
MPATAGIDVSYDSHRYSAALVIFHDDATWEVTTYEAETESPYVSGLFFLREAPALSCLLYGRDIDLLFVNGHGICHPYFFGLATVVGWTHRIRTIGVASRLIQGTHNLPPQQPGVSAITLKGHVVGAAMRLKEKGRPIFVSPGFGVSVEEAVTQCMRWTRCGKVPEPLRLAHLHARAPLRRKFLQGGSP